LSSLIIAGNTSGTITLDAPNVAGTTTLTLPTTNGTILTTANTFGAGTGPAFAVYSTVNQTTSTVTLTKIQLNTERFDTNSNFDSTTNYRFTPTVAGYYQISGAASYSTTTNNYGVAALIYKNGSAYAWGTATATTSMYSSAQVGSLIYCNGSTDYIELYVYNGSAASQTTVGEAAYTYMTGFLARSA
jgi:uncharacterized protein with NAD-binding domain and iron-sulfur cluster